MTINIGIIGYGLSGSVFHAPILDFLNEFNITAIVTSNENRKIAISKKYKDVSVYNTPDELFVNKNIECVVIAVPNMYHFTLAKKALINGKHVIIEKPFTTTVDKADILIELAKNKNLLLKVFHNRRFDSDFLTIKNVLSNNKLGNLKTYEAHFDRFRPIINKNKWKEIPNPGTGSLYDLGSHLIDQALVLFGMPISLNADIRIERDNAVTTDAFDITLFYDNFKVFLRSSSLIKELGPHFILHGDKGSFIKYGLDVQEEQLKANYPFIKHKYGKEPTMNYGVLNTIYKKTIIKSCFGDYRKFYLNIYDVLNNKKDLIIKPTEARDVIYIIEKSIESSNLRKNINI